MAETTDEDSDDKRTTCDTELHRNWHTRDGERYASEENTYNDTDEDSGDVRSVKTLDRVAHKVGNAVDIVCRTNYKNLIAYLETVVARCEEVHTLT